MNSIPRPAAGVWIPHPLAGMDSDVGSPDDVILAFGPQAAAITGSGYAPVDGNHFMGYDAKGVGSCGTQYGSVVAQAITYIRNNWKEITTTCVRNGADPTCGPQHGTYTQGCFGGRTPAGATPRSVVWRAVFGSSSTVVLQCRRTKGGCRRDCPGPAAFTPCGQEGRATQYVYLCKAFLDGVVSDRYAVAFLARVVVHEIFHLYGANESAAGDMEPAWGTASRTRYFSDIARTC